jgi:hypothetical protein
MLFPPPPPVKRPGNRRIGMSNERPAHDELYEEANRLYWQSDQSVNQIGETLDLSKGVLYGLIEALPTGLPCPECGEEMVYPNRTARDKGFLACPDCGTEEEEDAVRDFWQERGEPLGSDSPLTAKALTRRAGEAVQKAVGAGKSRVTSLSPRGRIITGTALLGLAAGLALGTYFRRR